MNGVRAIHEVEVRSLWAPPILKERGCFNPGIYVHGAYSVVIEETWKEECRAQELG
jgi:hypothetical protein